jgi:UDP:flavonoid glycosyltransferase YjiC (YdhE family)
MRRITERGALEIQAYEQACYPGLAAEWREYGDQRPFVGTITLELATAADDEVASWLAAGTPPICFGFGSQYIERPAETIAMIGAACAQLGVRALVCSGTSDFSNVPQFEHVKVVGLVNYATLFPACRAIVHHGGAGSLAACIRAGVPQLILWSAADRQRHGAVIKSLGVGTSRRFSAVDQKSLVEDLQTILTPDCATRAREIATRTNTPAESVALAADLVEASARRGSALRHNAAPESAGPS